MSQVFLSIGPINSNENCISFWTDEAVKTHSQKCALTIVQWPVFYLLCLWYFFVECLQAPCPYPVLKSCPRVFSPGPLHPDPLHIYHGTATDDSAVCCPVRHEPSMVHQVCLCNIYIIYMYILSMYWVFIIFSIEYQSFGIVVEQINKIICSTNYNEIIFR